MEGQELRDFQHVSCYRANDLEPVRKLEKMLRNEGRDRVAVVRPVDLGRAEAVDDDEASFGRQRGAVAAEFSKSTKVVQGLQDALDESSARIRDTTRKGEQVLEANV